MQNHPPRYLGAQSCWPRACLQGPLKTWVSGFNASAIVCAGSTDTVSAVAPGITASHAASYALDHTADDSQLACAVLALSATGKVGTGGVLGCSAHRRKSLPNRTQLSILHVCMQVEDRVSACLSGSNVNDRHSGGSKHASNSRYGQFPSDKHKPDDMAQVASHGHTHIQTHTRMHS